MKVKVSLLAVLALAACGGGLSTQDFQANAPTYDKLAISQNDGDQVAPAMDRADTNSQALTAAPTVVSATVTLKEKLRLA